MLERIKAFFWTLLETQQSCARRLDVSKALAYNVLYQTDGLHPKVEKKWKRLEKKMEKIAPVKISEGFRSAKRQDSLYAKGRTAPGKIVTNAKGLQSYHNYGLAIDVIFRDYGWNPPDDSYWQMLGRVGKSVGFEWGGDWSFYDPAHFQYRPDNVTYKELQKDYARKN